jgi:3-phenylpropionate/cinnamic acid dioxygenase small subunit
MPLSESQENKDEVVERAGQAISNMEYQQIVDFLYDEADILSAMDFTAWGQLLADDIHYLMPVPQFFEVGRERVIGIGTPLFDEDADSLKLRLALLGSGTSSTAENTRSALSLLVSNIRAAKLDADEYQVRSRFIMTRVQFGDSSPYQLAGRREDRLRRSGQSFKIVKRTVFLTQSTINTHNLSFFV